MTNYNEMTDEQRVELLQEVNTQVNSVPYVSDNDAFGEAPDTWKFVPDGKGFLCRDYAVGKAKELSDRGWPTGDLSIVLCYTEAGEYHAVLWVELSRQTWVLDNRYPKIYLWDIPQAYGPYQWALRQVAGTVEFKSIA